MPGTPTDAAFIETFNESFRDEYLNVKRFLHWRMRRRRSRRSRMTTTALDPESGARKASHEPGIFHFRPTLNRERLNAQYLPTPDLRNIRKAASGLPKIRKDTACCHFGIHP
jgi:hypothetical protein